MDNSVISAPRASAKNKVDNFVLSIFNFSFSELVKKEDKRNELYAHVELLISKCSPYNDYIEKFIVDNSNHKMIKYYLKASEIAKKINEKYDMQKYDYLFTSKMLLRAYTDNQNALSIDSIDETINKLESAGFDVSKCKTEKIVDEFGIPDSIIYEDTYCNAMFYKVP